MTFTVPRTTVFVLKVLLDMVPGTIVFVLTVLWFSVLCMVCVCACEGVAGWLAGWLATAAAVGVGEWLWAVGCGMWVSPTV